VEITKEHSCETLSQLAYQVPAGKQFTITDVAITDLSGTSRTVGIQRGVDGPFVFLRVFEGDTRAFNHPYQTGIVYQSLEEVAVRAEPCPGANVFFEIRGFLTDNN
jgi:hypothetical protein